MMVKTCGKEKGLERFQHQYFYKNQYVRVRTRKGSIYLQANSKMYLELRLLAVYPHLCKGHRVDQIPKGDRPAPYSPSMRVDSG
jgi:hypothetical protein